MIKRIALATLIFLGDLGAVVSSLTPIVTAELFGQMGNNMFQVATACALAWDHGCDAYFPNLGTIPKLYQHMFSRCKATLPHDNIAFEWKEPEFTYHPIPFTPNMKLVGYFQSEKYFAHHRERLLQLFAPCSRDLGYIQKKYHWLIDHPNTVGVQIRYYLDESEAWIQYGIDYLEKAMALFPDSSLFIVSSNNLEFARKNIPTSIKNVVFLEGEPHYIDFHLLCLCKHNIITNSTFGWWSAWLNRNPNKIVVRPSVWLLGLPSHDVCPTNWIEIHAEKVYNGF